MKKILPIGNDQFQEILQNNIYYIDKTLMIKDFIEYQDKVALITRPRRFGKTLGMTMLREFFDITKNSQDIFKGLAIMDTQYAGQINSRPVIYFSFKDCTGSDKEILRDRLSKELLHEYARYSTIFENQINTNDIYVKIFHRTLMALESDSLTLMKMAGAIEELVRVVHDFYDIPPLLLIDEYDQPILSSYEHHYKDDISDFFAAFYGSSLKSNQYLGQALLTGIQRVAKESIFSKLNNIQVYSVLDTQYNCYFGLTPSETAALLQDYDLKLDETVRKKYNGYLFGGQEIYNPWSVLTYAKRRLPDNYWINTSTNFLVKEALLEADEFFGRDFESLLKDGTVEIGATLETSFIELQNNYSLWGLLVNSGYLTVIKRKITSGSANRMTVKIPNNEVRYEFQRIVAEQAHIDDSDLGLMFDYLLEKNLEKFMELYSKIVLSCTSYFDAKENAYHMLFLGMCITLRGAYKVTSNLEAGLGRSDITLESLNPRRPHIIIELKQGEDISTLKQTALAQIKEQQYGANLQGEVFCVGIAHNGKRCEVVGETYTFQ